MKITIFGSGYVGLTTGTCFAQMGNHVMCIDIDAQRVNKLNNGDCPIFEPGLAEMLQENLKTGRIVFSTDAKAGVQHGDIIFIAVGTPSQTDGSAKLDYVLIVADTIGEHINEYKVVVNKSTVPVGTADKVKAHIDQQLKQRSTPVNFDVASNPEFLKEGVAVNDFLKPDRIVIGVASTQAEQSLRALYAPFNRNHDKLISMDIRSAELTKYAANAMLATKISFMNEISQIAERVGADIENVRLGIGSDSRIGYSFIYPGCGYGGSCFPKDVQALQHTATTHHYEPNILNSVHTVNERQKFVLLEKIRHYFGDKLSGKRFAMWGLAFKPNTDDVREAPSRIIMEGLWQGGASVCAYDPEAHDSIRAIYGDRSDLSLSDSPEAALENADALIIVTEWMAFRSPDFNLIKDKLNHAVIFDGRNLYEPDHLEKLGFDYFAIGRGKSVNAITTEQEAIPA
ncbi:MAG: UDP-glucose/GDP-mannose dehydrogenase family protein [Gammaproteobacteria bacterium]|nr:UDP-glucose/GDP-mannose dehydrogenase family protein [Gammaproteobacteria bacterium]